MNDIMFYIIAIIFSAILAVLTILNIRNILKLRAYRKELDKIYGGDVSGIIFVNTSVPEDEYFELQIASLDFAEKNYALFKIERK